MSTQPYSWPAQPRFKRASGPRLEQAQFFTIESDPAYLPPNTRIDRNARFEDAREKKAEKIEHEIGTREEQQRADVWMPLEPFSQDTLAHIDFHIIF